MNLANSKRTADKARRKPPHRLEGKTPGATSQAGKPSKRSEGPEGVCHFQRVAHLQKGASQAVMLPKTVKDTPSEDQHLLEEGPEPGGSPNPKTGTLAIGGPWQQLGRTSLEGDPKTTKIPQSQYHSSRYHPSN